MAIITKTYKAKGLAEAVDLIKREMGAKASIVSTKRNTVKPGFFRSAQPEIEVTASVDERFLTREQLEYLNASSAKRSAVESSFDGTEAVKFRWSKAAKERARESQKVLGFEDDQPDFAAELAEPGEKEHEELEFEETAVVPEEEIQEPAQPNSLDQLDALLRMQGIEDDLFGLWYKHCETLPQNLTLEEWLDECATYFLDHFKALDQDLPKRVGFIGPAGSGKTSSVLKLAYKIKKDKKQVAVFTLDGNLGVTEEMKMACANMQVPFCVIHQMRTFQNIIKDYEHYDHILIDTTSVSPKNIEETQELNKKLQHMEAKCLIVLSAKDVDNDRIVDSLKDFNTIGLVFSRIDELFSAGVVFNLLYKISLPVAFYGIGQNTEEDIEVATAERLVSILFGLEEQG